MDFAWTDEEAALRVTAREVAQAGAQKYGSTPDSWMTGFSRDFARELAGLGWIGLTWPREVGGGGKPALHRLIIGEELIRAGAPIAAMWFADRQIGPMLIACGTPEQQAAYLPAILAGDASWCIGMSEPGAGSDVAGIRTSARLVGEEWVISGQKIWTSHAAVADYCYLICRTGSVEDRHRGISEIIVPMSAAGITVRPIIDTTGAEHFCEVFFDEVRVPVGNLVGDQGAAFKQTMIQLDHERGGVDRLVSNFLLYRACLERVDRSNQHQRQLVGQLEADYHAGALLVRREAVGQAPGGYSALTKAFCTEHEQRVAEFAWAVLGEAALVDIGWHTSLNYAPSYSIMGGTAEILRNIIAERILGLPR